ncbi:23S rRNA (adenine(2030)-N(6))-methyltransferase RlmJ [Lysobacter xanthus]
MNYRHAFHAGNHADVLKHAALLELCDALCAKPAPLFALDTHAGRGLYFLNDPQARRTQEAEGGIGRLASAEAPALRRYLQAIAACRKAHGLNSYPGSPWLLAHALRPQDRIACCELQAEEAVELESRLGADPRVAIHTRDGYSGMRALLPPKHGSERIARGLVLIDPPYESQLAEYDDAFSAIREALTRFPQATYALWYPIKLRRSLQQMYRRAAQLPARSVMVAELLVRRDDSPLRMNGSGLLVLNAPYQFDARLRALLPPLAGALGEDAGAGWKLDWLKAAP